MPRSLLSYTAPPARFDVTLGAGATGARELVLTAATPPEHAPTPSLPLPPATFRAFADVPPTAEGVRTFAQQFGWLTVPQAYHQIAGYPDRRHGEPVAVWEREIHRLRRWVAVWEAWRAGDLEALATALAVATVELSGDLDFGVTEDPAGTKVRLVTWKLTGGIGQPRDETFIAQIPAMLAVGITHELTQVLSPAAGLTVALTESHGGVVLAPRAASLLGAIWLQFTHALANGLTVRPCHTCGTWFEVGPGARPKNRLYCSPKCKLRWFREQRGGARGDAPPGRLGV